MSICLQIAAAVKCHEFSCCIAGFFHTYHRLTFLQTLGTIPIQQHHSASSLSSQDLYHKNALALPSSCQKGSASSLINQRTSERSRTTLRTYSCFLNSGGSSVPIFLINRHLNKISIQCGIFIAFGYIFQYAQLLVDISCCMQ